MTMKNHVLAAQQLGTLAAAPWLDASVSFLFGRQQVIDLSPLEPAANSGYVWRKIFLKDRR